MKSAYELKVISQQAGGQRSRGRVRQIKTQKRDPNEILSRGAARSTTKSQPLGCTLEECICIYGRCEDLEI